MDFWQYTLLGAACISLWLGRRNGTLWALALAYFNVQAWWLLNDRAPLQVGDLFMVDLVTILLIYCKAIARDTSCIEYESTWHQLRCFALAPTPQDRLILISFPLLTWPAYVLTIDPWWWLYWVSMAQFLIAGSEAFHEWRKAKAPLPEPGNPSSGLQFAWAGAERWST